MSIIDQKIVACLKFCYFFCVTKQDCQFQGIHRRISKSKRKLFHGNFDCFFQKLIFLLYLIGKILKCKIKLKIKKIILHQTANVNITFIFIVHLVGYCNFKFRKPLGLMSQMYDYEVLRNFFFFCCDRIEKVFIKHLKRVYKLKTFQKQHVIPITFNCISLSKLNSK